MALWEVPLCALPSDKSSFPRERGAELECKSKGKVGPQEVQLGDPKSKQRADARLFVCLFAWIKCNFYVNKKRNAVFRHKFGI